MSKEKITFNPDKLVLTKDDIITLMNAISKRWSKNRTQNYKYIIGIQAMKAGIMITGEDTIQKIWSEILDGFQELLYQNALAVGKGEKEHWAFALEKVKTKFLEDAE